MKNLLALLARKWLFYVIALLLLNFAVVMQVSAAGDGVEPRAAIFDISSTILAKQSDYDKLTPAQREAFSKETTIVHGGKEKTVYLNVKLLKHMKTLQGEGVELFINSTGKTDEASLTTLLKVYSIDIPSNHIFIAKNDLTFSQQLIEGVKKILHTTGLLKNLGSKWIKGQGSLDTFKEDLKDIPKGSITLYDDKENQRKWAEEAGLSAEAPWGKVAQGESDLGTLGGDGGIEGPNVGAVHEDTVDGPEHSGDEHGKLGNGFVDPELHSNTGLTHEHEGTEDHIPIVNDSDDDR